MLTSFDHRDFELERLRASKACPISVVLPARGVQDTIGEIVRLLGELDGLIDQIVVVDAASEDRTVERAESAGAEVYQEAQLLPDFGPVLGKGDAMWRALSVTRGELVCFIDADTTAFGPHFALGLLGPLIAAPQISFVKAAYTRPFTSGAVKLAGEGGRVTELMARPLLSAFYPEVARFSQPLAGEVAARRQLLASIGFATGYAVEISMLLEVWSRVGLECMAEVDLGERRNAHQPLRDLGPMAHAVLVAVVERLRGEGRFPADEPLGSFVDATGQTLGRGHPFRPPLTTLETAR